MNPPCCLAIRMSPSLRDRTAVLDFKLVKDALVRTADVEWKTTAIGEGFSFRDDPETFFLTYASAEGAAIHYLGNERALMLCRQIAQTLSAYLIVI